MVRWGKPVASEITSPAHANCVDDRNGNYVIHIAAQNGQLAALMTILRMKAHVNRQNKKGHTALHMAIAYSYQDAATVLRVRQAPNAATCYLQSLSLM